MGSTQVFLVDDDNGINQTLHKLFNSVNLSHKIFTSAEDFLKQYQGEDGCLVLDIRLKGMSGMLLQEHLKNQKFSIPIIFLTGHGNIQMAVKAMK